MKLKILVIGTIFILLTNIASASSPYGSIDVYYNDKILPGKEIAKPVLKIGEPFKVRFDFTVHQKCYVSVKLSELGKNNFVIIDGPTSKIEEYYGKIMEENSTEVFEWTVKPTENWAGGSIPIDFVYQVDELGAGGKTLVNGEFTVVYCTISKEYYEGKIPTSENHPVSETEPSSTSASTPAFTLLSAISVLALAFALFRR
ncbi:MAG: sarcinarray family MAST domain-containing protein [Methanosarcina sp.]|uniref:sarcinarray family MAST domain-containing protein n=1 Tax=Methanosarcina sp. TaxID=2213 RepID=UPI00263820C0|nr:sarcinarray family MAST domain-containing protein [Methanosarcina sp.]MDD3246593.1 sarcinarray family MAST domain-containing protein [Methanosarcina sp.]MDD4248155.1 sarcinarray family MAST domain-containing protein [Methanosarcina sp.]